MAECHYTFQPVNVAERNSLFINQALNSALLFVVVSRYQNDRRAKAVTRGNVERQELRKDISRKNLLAILLLMKVVMYCSIGL